MTINTMTERVIALPPTAPPDSTGTVAVRVSNLPDSVLLSLRDAISAELAARDESRAHRQTT